MLDLSLITPTRKCFSFRKADALAFCDAWDVATTGKDWSSSVRCTSRVVSHAFCSELSCVWSVRTSVCFHDFIWERAVVCFHDST